MSADSAEAIERQTTFYFTVVNALWPAEQIVFVIFSIALLFVLRVAGQKHHETSNQAMQRMTQSPPLTRPFGLITHVARRPAAPFAGCATF